MADDKFDFEQISNFGVCRTVCHDSSLYIFVLVIIIEVIRSIQHFISVLFTLIGVLLCLLSGLNFLLFLLKLSRYYVPELFVYV